MIGYWTRIAAAWLLLHFASRLVKDTEKMFRAATEKQNVKPDAVVRAEA